MFMEISVHEGRAARADEFGAAESGSDIQKLVIQLEFHRPDVIFQPLHERQVVCNATEQCHGQVGMAVHKAGHEQCAREVKPLFRSVSRVNDGVFINVKNNACINGNTDASKDPALIILGNGRIRPHEQIALRGGGWIVILWHCKASVYVLDGFNEQGGDFFHIPLEDFKDVFPGDRGFVGLPAIVIRAHGNGGIGNARFIGQDAFGSH